MGLWGTLARKTGAAALRGGVQLVGVVVPRSMSPWDLRKKTTRTSASIFRLVSNELKKRKKKKKASTKGLRASRPQVTNGTKVLQLEDYKPWYLTGKPRPTPTRKPAPAAPAAAPYLVALPPRPPAAPRKPGPRPSTTKGKTNFSRRATSPAAAARPSSPVLMVVQQPVPNEVKFNKNSWARGAGLTSSADWDTPSPTRYRPSSRLARAGRRKKRLVNDRHKEHVSYLNTKRKDSKPVTHKKATGSDSWDYWD